MQSIKKGFLKFKNRLTTFNNDEPLSKLSLVVIIFLDIFILTMLFGGLDDHTKQLTAPYEYVPYKCRSVFISGDLSRANDIDSIGQIVLSDYNCYDYRYQSTFKDAKINVMHEICADFYQSIKAIAEDSELKNLFVQRQSLIKKKKSFNQKFNKSKNVYDTSLLKDIANKQKTEKEINTLSASMDNTTAEIERFNSQIEELEEQIKANHKVQHVLNMVYDNSTQNREILIKAIKNFEFWYPLRELAWQLLFMLPIFIVFYIWYSRSVKKQNNIQTLIASHLLVVAAWPILLKTIQVALELIPHRFFKNLFELLQKLHLIAVWHYLLIILSIIVALLIVYIIQKKLFSKEVLYQKRLIRGACFKCGKKLPTSNVNACPYCGVSQTVKCTKCNLTTYKSGKHCINCGDELSNE